MKASAVKTPDRRLHFRCPHCGLEQVEKISPPPAGIEFVPDEVFDYTCGPCLLEKTGQRLFSKVARKASEKRNRELDGRAVAPGS